MIVHSFLYVYQEGITSFGRATPILDIFPSNIPMFAWAIA